MVNYPDGSGVCFAGEIKLKSHLNGEVRVSEGQWNEGQWLWFSGNGGWKRNPQEKECKLILSLTTLKWRPEREREKEWSLVEYNWLKGDTTWFVVGLGTFVYKDLSTECHNLRRIRIGCGLWDTVECVTQSVPWQSARTSTVFVCPNK